MRAAKLTLHFDRFMNNDFDFDRGSNSGRFRRRFAYY